MRLNEHERHDQIVKYSSKARLGRAPGCVTLAENVYEDLEGAVEEAVVNSISCFCLSFGSVVLSMNVFEEGESV